MAKATYFYEFNGGLQSLELQVLAENKDGTLELGRKAEGEDRTELVIGKCPVSAAPADGRCVRIAEAAENVAEASQPNRRRNSRSADSEE